MKIKDKTEFFALWKDMKLGNRIAMWSNYEDLVASGFDGKVSMRYKDASANAFKANYIPVDKVLDKLNEFALLGARRDFFAFNESAPDDKLVIQGECCHTFGGFHLSYSHMQGPMHLAMSDQYARHVQGLQALGVMRAYLDPAGYEMIQELFDMYPDAAIEFGMYSCNVGVMPGHKVLIWEVREY